MTEADQENAVLSDEEREDYRRLVDTWRQLCGCGGPQPAPGNKKLDRHEHDCNFVAWCNTVWER